MITGIAPRWERVSAGGERLTSSLQPDRFTSDRATVVAVAAPVIGLLVAAIGPDSTAGRAAFAVGLIVGLTILSLRDRGQGLVALLLWLVALGLTRRVVSTFQFDPERDPLLAVAPFVSLVLTGRAVAAGALRRLTPMVVAVVAMTAVVAVAAFNPGQDSVGSAVAGVLLWAGPLVYFWIGRASDPLAARRVGAVVLSAALVTAVYGAFQLLVDLPPWDQHWVDARGIEDDRHYASVFIGPDTVRPFGAATSATGYALLMGAASVTGLALAVRAVGARATRAALGWGAVSLMSFAMLVASAVRTVLAFTLVAMVVVGVVATGRSLWKAAAAAVGVGLVVMLALNQVDPDSLDTAGVEGSVRRVVIGVGHPFSDSYEQTLDTHIEVAGDGIETGFREPFGSGPGVVGLAGDRFGGGGANAEADLPNAGLAFGVAGMAGVLAIVAVGVMTLVRALRRVLIEPDAARLVPLAIGAFAVAFVSVIWWFNGAHWAMAPLAWLGLGWADRWAWADGSDPVLAARDD